MGYVCGSSYDEVAASQTVAGRSQANSSCEKYYVNVFFHFIRDNNGNTGQDVSNIPQYMNLLNSAFNPHEIYFAYAGRDEIRNSTWAATDFNYMDNYSSVAGTQANSNAINIYLFRSDSNHSGGRAFIPSTNVVIGGNDFFASNLSLSHVLTHEVGHALNLLHTHETAYCAENPDGSDGTTCGDLVADTPADPNISFSNFGDCTNPFVMTVGIETYNPDPRNIMSYATVNCLSLLTPGQGERVRNSLNSLSVLQPIQNIQLSITNYSPICFDANRTYTLYGVPAGSMITWNTSSNIQVVSGSGTNELMVKAATSQV